MAFGAPVRPRWNDASTGELVLKFVNGTSEAYPGEIQLKGITGVQHTGKVITLVANSETDENSFEEPRKIYPKETSFNEFGKQFNYEFPPYSYTILRIKSK